MPPGDRFGALSLQADETLDALRRLGEQGEKTGTAFRGLERGSEALGGLVTAAAQPLARGFGEVRGAVESIGFRALGTAAEAAAKGLFDLVGLGREAAEVTRDLRRGAGEVIGAGRGVERAVATAGNLARQGLEVDPQLAAIIARLAVDSELEAQRAESVAADAATRVVTERLGASMRNFRDQFSADYGTGYR